MLKKLFIAISGATNAVATVAPFKYNKLGNATIAFDDGSPGHIVAQALFDTLFYTDGCGNNINFSLSLAINGGTGLPGDPAYNENYIQKPAIDALLAKRGDIENHGMNHGGLNSDDDLNQLHDQILLRVGYKMGFTVVPSASTGFAHASYLKKYNGITAQSDTTFDEFQGIRVHKTYPAIADPYEFMALVRDFDDNWDSGTTDFFIAEYDRIITGERNFHITGTHSALDTTEKLNNFTDLFNYVQDSLDDQIMVCCMREILDYKRMQIMPISQSFSNGVLAVEVDVEDPDELIRFYDLSLNITTDGTIAGVTADGFDTTSYNPVTGLVNGFKERLVWGAPEPEVPQEIIVKHGKFVIA